jgi:integrase
MTPHRSGGDRGTLMIDKRIRGVGRLRIAIGSNDERTLKQVESMVATLRMQGRIDLLCGLRDRHYGVGELLTAFRLNDFDQLPTRQALEHIDAKWAAWQATLAPDSQKQARYARQRLEAQVRPLTFAALAGALTAYRATVPGMPVFNRFRSIVMAFLRETVSQESPVYKAVRAVRPFKEAKQERKGFPLAVDQVRAILERLSPKAGRAFWTMCATGMGNKEFFDDGWEVAGDVVLIHGQKRQGRDRRVPVWAPLYPVEISENGLRAALARLPGGIVPYCARKTFARWCEEAGIIATNRTAYMGHGPKSMTDLYTMGELPGQLAADARKLQEYVQFVPGQVPGRVNRPRAIGGAK